MRKTITSYSDLKDGETQVTLKREYYKLNHDVHKDFRKRIDTIIGEK